MSVSLYHHLLSVDCLSLVLFMDELLASFPLILSFPYRPDTYLVTVLHPLIVSFPACMPPEPGSCVKDLNDDSLPTDVG